MPKKSAPVTTPKRQGLKRKEATEVSQILLNLEPDRLPGTFPLYVGAIKGARESLQNAAVTGEGQPTPFYRALQVVGPWHLLNDQHTCLALQKLWEEARQGDNRAQKILQEVGKALSWVGQGQVSPLTDHQKAQRQKESSRTSHHKKRAAEACARAKNRFCRAIQDQLPNDPKDPKRVQAIACDVEEKEFSRLGKETRAFALIDYCEFINSFPKSLSSPKRT